MKLNAFSLTIFGLLVATLPATAQTAEQTDSFAFGCPFIKVETECLPDMNIPRAGHETFFVNGELVVAGGHTNGFVPTPTAEYFKNGKWHQTQMVYNHDFGFSVILKSGKVLLAGGCEQPIGIGQTHLAEFYDPQTHTFNAFASMQQKRTWASGLELDNGQVVIAGNWYHNDGIEVYDGKDNFVYTKDAMVARSHPYILRTAKDDAIIFGTMGTQGDTISLVADRLKGDTLTIPFFETWKPLSIPQHRFAESFIGDESKGLYTYLIPVQDSTSQVAIAKVENGVFSILPTTCPIPMRNQWEQILYNNPIIVDRQARRAYMMGISGDFVSNPNKPHRLYFLCVDYAQAVDGKPAPMTLYYTDPIQNVPDCPPVLDEKGNILITGGFLQNSNFTPSAAAYLIRVNGQTETLSAFWPWSLLAIVVFVSLIAYLIIFRKRHHASQETADSPMPDPDNELMNRITHLMEEQKLFQKSDLKVSDIAAELGTNSRYISDCIKSCKDCSFTQFVNTCRVEYAMKLMRDYPDKKMMQVYMESGFANETTFFRAFKAQTGLTPNEWKSGPSKP